MAPATRSAKGKALAERNMEEKCDQMGDFIKRPKECLEENYVSEIEKLKDLLEASQKKCNEIELLMKAKEEELNSLKEKFAKEQSDKLEAMDSFTKEKEARLSGERLQASLSEYLNRAGREIADMNQKIQSLHDLYKPPQERNTSLQRYNIQLQEELGKAYDALKRVEKEKAAVVENLSTLRGHYTSLQEQLTSSRGRCLYPSEQIRKLQEQLAFAEKKSVMSAMETRTEFKEQKKFILELQNRLADAEMKIVEGEKLRKKLHNTILELKGNIRVFCRVRPLLSDDADAPEMKVISFPTSMERLGRGIDLSQNGQKYSFTFDKVFMPDASQEDVFVEISQLVQSALDGYKVCIFAYGQTGSGKTYTMMGKPGNSDQKGLIPRTLEQVFETRQTLQSQGWKYEMQVSMLEIYNETIRDLLSPNRSGFDISKTENGGKQFVIKHDANGNSHVSDLTVIDVCSSREVSYLLERAAQSRSVGKTQMNEQSSRSHFVFTLRIFGVNESTEQQVQGVLNLIDLAGSERLSKSGSTGDRLKETQAINKSLSSLSDVIFALAKKEEHVPFRNSKLTYLLQTHVPSSALSRWGLEDFDVCQSFSRSGESLCSLRFAARVNACKIGIPRRQTSMRSI